MSDTPRLVTLTIEGAVARLRIERSEVLNALSPAVIRQLRTAVETVRADRSIRAVVVAGAGEKAFVAGADIAAMQTMGADEALQFAREGQELTLALERLPQLTIARVQGFALGGGCELAMACDVIVATPKAKFGQPEVNLGLVPGFGGTQRLTKRVGLPIALDMLCSGRMLGGEEAYRLGLISRLAAEDKLDEEVGLVVKGLLKAGPLAVAEAKRLARESYAMSLEAGLNAEASAFAAAFAIDEAREGLKAFIEKRPAPFAKS